MRGTVSHSFKAYHVDYTVEGGTKWAIVYARTQQEAERKAAKKYADSVTQVRCIEK